MIVVISKTDLVSMIGKIQNVVASKPTAPILGNILIEAANDLLTLSATDLMVSIRCHMQAKVIQEGAIALPGRKLFQLIRELTSPQIKISVGTNEIAEITTGTSVFKINGMNKEGFPSIPDLLSAPKLEMPSSLLKEMLSQTAFSAAREDSRYMLNGVQLLIHQQRATFIGTDGKRLAKTMANVAIDSSIQGQYVIPLKAIEEMGKLLPETEEKVALRIHPDKVCLECQSQTLTTKLLSGQYPDVQRVIPEKVAYEFAIHREELLTLLRQVSLFTSETSGSVRFVFEAGALQLTGANSDIGEGRVSMPVNFSGPRFEIAFNPFYFLDILRHCKEETVRMGLSDSHSPGVITSGHALFIIMPMRLSETTLAPKKEVEATV